MQSKEPEAIAQAVALTFMGDAGGELAGRTPGGHGGLLLAGRLQADRRSGRRRSSSSIDQGEAEAGKPPATAVFPDGTRGRAVAGQGSARGLRRLADRARESLVRPQHRQSHLVLAAGARHHSRAGRHSARQPAQQSRSCWPGWKGNWSAHDYDLKHLYRLILNSQTYQLSSIPPDRSCRTPRRNFAYYPLRRLDAEVLIDALCQITGTTEEYSSPIPEPFTFIPGEQRSIALADGSITSSFLEMFGRPPRDTGLESERNNSPTAAQRLHLLNSSHIQQQDRAKRASCAWLMRSRRNPREIDHDALPDHSVAPPDGRGVEGRADVLAVRRGGWRECSSI